MSLRFGFKTLPLGNAFEPPLVLVNAFDALGIVREGGYRLGERGFDADRAMDAVADHMRWNAGMVRDFVKRASGAFADDPNADSDDDVLNVLRHLLRDGSVAVLVRDDRAKAADATQGPMEKAWAAYATFAMRFGKEFFVASHKYRLSSRDQVAAIRETADYDVVPKAEAATLVQKMADDARSPKLTDAAKTLAESLVDLRDPSDQQGLVLLRASATRARQVVSPEDVITPAKLRKLRDEKEEVAEIQLERRYHDDQPVQGAHFIMLMDDGSEKQGDLNREGKATIPCRPQSKGEVRFGPDERKYAPVERPKNKGYVGKVPTESELVKRLDELLASTSADPV